MTSFRAVAIALAMALSGPSLAASDYPFRLHNQSDGWTIDGFYTYQNGRWSENWLRGRVAPGQSVRMNWHSNAGDCVVPFRVSWQDYGAEDFKVDWCKVSNIYMRNQGFRWD